MTKFSPIRFIIYCFAFIHAQSVYAQKYVPLVEHPPTCSGLFESDKKSSSPAFWNQHNQILVGPQKMPLTFSNDTELAPDIVSSILQQYPEQLGTLRTHTTVYSSWQLLTDAINLLRHDEGLKELRFESSEEFIEKTISKQARSALNLKSLSVLDLKPSLLAWFLTLSGKLRSGAMTELFWTNLPHAVHAILKQMGSDFQVVYDSETDIEVKTRSYQMDPAALKQEIEILKKASRFTSFMRILPSIHFHIGIPKNISLKSFLSIVQALEFKIILERLSAFEPGSAPSIRFIDSSLKFKSIQKGTTMERGVIKFDLLGFETPNSSFDLEIRQWLSINNGLESVELAAILAKNYELLTFEPLLNPVRFVDPNYGGILNALGLLIKKLPDDEVKEFSALYEEIRSNYMASLSESNLRITPIDLISRFQKLLKKFNLVDRIRRVDFYLK